MAELRQETTNDSTMVKLAKIIQEEWPNHKQKVPKQVREYWTFRDELVVIDGLILKDETIIVPQVLRKDILAQIHEGHLGIERKASSARFGILARNDQADRRHIDQLFNLSRAQI